MWLPHNDAPGLAMARAFGDFCLKEFGLISVPEISYRRIIDEDEFVVLATDGVRCQSFIPPQLCSYHSSLHFVELGIKHTFFAGLGRALERGGGNYRGHLPYTLICSSSSGGCSS